MAKRPLVTLTTDFGVSDPYVAAMKGVLLRFCPHADIVDITHDIPQHQILSGAFVLANAAPYFPTGTLHVVVVDPGVGTERSILVGQYGGQLYLFPDNGIITFIKQLLPLEALVSVRNPRVMPESSGVSNTFQGRDLFAPLAGKILNGANIGDFGPTPRSYKLLDLPEPYYQDGVLHGRIIYIDHFGNLISNISREAVGRYFREQQPLITELAGHPVGSLVETYGLVEPGRPLALFNSMELLEVAVNQARAVDTFHGQLGMEIRIRQQEFIEA